MTTTKPTNRKAGRRWSQRGAALTESAVSIPFFIIIFGCGIWAHRIYNKKVQTLTQARNEVHTQALQGCEGGEGQSPYAASGGGSLGQADGAQGMDTARKGFGGITVTKTDSVTGVGAGKYLTLTSLSVTTTTKMMCDEIPREGSLTGVAGYLWGLMNSVW